MNYTRILAEHQCNIKIFNYYTNQNSVLGTINSQNLFHKKCKNAEVYLYDSREFYETLNYRNLYNEKIND